MKKSKVNQILLCLIGISLLSACQPKLKQTSSKDSTPSSSHVQPASSQDSLISDTSTYSTMAIEKINQDFGTWLFNSDYAKDAVVVHGAPEDPQFMSSFRGGDVAIWEISTVDGPMLTRITGLYENLDITTGRSQTPNYYLDGSLEQFATKLQSYQLGRLGAKLGSTQTADYVAKSAFRLYSLSDKTHEFYSFEDEQNQIIATKVPAEANYKATAYGYQYLYDNLVDANLPSYQIILGSNGVVYWVEDFKNGSQSTYQKAPQDLQDKYQELLQMYKEETSPASSDSVDSVDTSEVPTETANGIQINVDALVQGDYSSLLGKWKNANGDTIEFYHDGTYRHVGTYNGETYDTLNELTYPQNDNGLFAAGTRLKDPQAKYGAGFIAAPAGTTLPFPSDISEVQKDRIAIGQSVPAAEEIFYRITE